MDNRLKLTVSVLILLGAIIYRVSQSETMPVETQQIVADLPNFPMKLDVATLKESLAIVDNVNEDPSHYVIFFIEPKVCAPCIAEVEEYDKLIRQKYDGVQTVTLVNTFDENDFQRFVTVAHFKMPVIKRSDLFARSFDNQKLDQWQSHMIMIDQAGSVLGYQFLPPSSFTPVESKLEVLAMNFGY